MADPTTKIITALVKANASRQVVAATSAALWRLEKNLTTMLEAEGSQALGALGKQAGSVLIANDPARCVANLDEEAEMLSRMPLGNCGTVELGSKTTDSDNNNVEYCELDVESAIHYIFADTSESNAGSNVVVGEPGSCHGNISCDDTKLGSKTGASDLSDEQYDALSEFLAGFQWCDGAENLMVVANKRLDDFQIDYDQMITAANEWVEELRGISHYGMEDRVEELEQKCRSEFHKLVTSHNSKIDTIRNAYLDLFALPGRLHVLGRCANLSINPELFDELLYLAGVTKVVHLVSESNPCASKKKRVRTKRK